MHLHCHEPVNLRLVSWLYYLRAISQQSGSYKLALIFSRRFSPARALKIIEAAFECLDKPPVLPKSKTYNKRLYLPVLFRVETQYFSPQEKFWKQRRARH